MPAKKKVVKRKPPVKPLISQNQKNQQQQRITVNLGTAPKGKRRYQRRRTGVSTVSQPTQNVVNVSPQFAPSFVPSFPSFASPVIGSYGGFETQPQMFRGLGNPINQGDSNSSVPTFNSGFNTEIASRSGLITQAPPISLMTGSIPQEDERMARVNYPEMIVPIFAPVSEDRSLIASIDPSQSGSSFITQPPAPPPTFASTITGLAGSIFGPAVRDFVNKPIIKKATPKIPNFKDIAPMDNRFISPRPPPPPANTIKTDYLSDFTMDTRGRTKPEDTLSYRDIYGSSVGSNAINPMGGDPSKKIEMQIKGDIAQPFDVNDLTTVGSNEIFVPQQLDVVYPDSDIFSRGVINPNKKPPINVIGGGRKKPDVESESESEKSTSGANIIPEGVGRRLPAIPENRPIENRRPDRELDKLTLTQLQQIARENNIQTLKKGKTGNSVRRTKEELKFDYRALFA